MLEHWSQFINIGNKILQFLQSFISDFLWFQVWLIIKLDYLRHLMSFSHQIYRAFLAKRFLLVFIIKQSMTCPFLWMIKAFFFFICLVIILLSLFWNNSWLVSQVLVSYTAEYLFLNRSSNLLCRLCEGVLLCFMNLLSLFFDILESHFHFLAILAFLLYWKIFIQKIIDMWLIFFSWISATAFNIVSFFLFFSWKVAQFRIRRELWDVFECFTEKTCIDINVFGRDVSIIYYWLTRREFSILMIDFLCNGWSINLFNVRIIIFFIVYFSKLF